MRGGQPENYVVEGAILIVEDHDSLRKRLRDWLSDMLPNCQFWDAKSGEEALALALARQPDIIVMDISLPGINGIEATRAVKADLPQAEVVIVTTHENAEYQASATAAGASAYVLKRKMASELVPVIEMLLTKSVGPAFFA